MANIGLTRARANAKDEFYTTFPDIAEELAAYPQAFCNQTVLLPCDAPPSSQFLRYFLFNFKRLGLRKLIATAYVPHGHGTLFLYEREKQPFSQTLAGDGDFRSLEVTKLRDAADIIVTNPPFSLFREFLSWIFQGNKKFLILGNINAVTYKEVFPLFKENQLWLGYTTQLKKKFTVPSDYPLEASRCGKDADGTPYIYVKGITWFTNLAHAKRNQPLPLASMQDNLLHHTKLRKKLLTTYGKRQLLATEVASLGELSYPNLLR